MKYLKYLKLFEDYHQFNKSEDEWHRSNDFTKEEEKQVRDFAKEKGFILGDIIGIGFGGVAFEIENDKSKVLKYTYDDIEAGVCGFLKNKNTTYFADIYEMFDFKGVWVILLEKLKELDYNTINDLQIISNKIDGNKINEYNFDDITYNETLRSSLSDNQKKLYDELIAMRKEASELGFDLLDCKIDNLGLKNGHIAMFDIKER